MNKLTGKLVIYQKYLSDFSAIKSALICKIRNDQNVNSILMLSLNHY